MDSIFHTSISQVTIDLLFGQSLDPSTHCDTKREEDGLRVSYCSVSLRSIDFACHSRLRLPRKTEIQPKIWEE